MESIKPKKPNFFIIGAPKCGTTSWACWLGQHSQVYFSAIKEPHFFNTDQPYYHVVRDVKAYENLFRKATSEQKGVGEASVFYLYSKEAVKNIIAYAPKAKFLVCIRNPVEMAHALHAQLLLAGDEHIHDFWFAWQLQERRRCGCEITRWTREPSHLVYGDVCKVGDQLDRLFKTAAREVVHIIVLDDVKENPRAEYLKALDFLGLEHDNFADFVPQNTSKTLRSRAVLNLARSIGLAKAALGIRASFGLANRMFRWTQSGPPRSELSKNQKEQLKDFFREDVERLSTILGRDLTAWVRPSVPHDDCIGSSQGA